MVITLKIPDGCKMLHFVLVVADDERNDVRTTDGHFIPEDGAVYAIRMKEEVSTNG